MRLKHLIIIASVCGLLVSAKDGNKPAVADGKENKQIEEETQEDTDAANERVETISADINFNSWSELYDYIKELEEATTGQELEETG